MKKFILALAVLIVISFSPTGIIMTGSGFAGTGYQMPKPPPSPPKPKKAPKPKKPPKPKAPKAPAPAKKPKAPPKPPGVK
jgi:hypothetical protein